MSLYDMACGQNPDSELIINFLGFSIENIPRFRDCYLEDEKIVIYTRTGGGNRKFYESRESRELNYPKGAELYLENNDPYNEDLRKNKHYIKDEDDEFESTYAKFFFRIPDQYLHDVLKISERNSKTSNQKWQEAFDALDKP